MAEFVKVIVRCRPLNEREVENDVDVVVTLDSTEQQIVLRHSSSNVNYPRKVFTFDRVFDTVATNEQIYNDAVSPLVESVLDGYNCCIFAYGQTSCGKTFSMQGTQTPSFQRGIMCRTFDQIFEYIQTTDVTYCVVRASYLEIYNEEIRDLLHKHNTHKLVVKEHPEKGVYVRDLTTVDVMCIEDMEEVLEVGSWNRVFGSTDQNPDSSRSHCIFTIEYELCFTSDEDEKEHFRSGRINLVDLAGSERQRYSRSHGERFKEATKINLSLSALGNVISALVNEKSKHIPYRASKLTRLLQDSLGGNSRTLMIACISPGENNESETLSTLRYANRAKNIKNRPRINEDPKDALIRQYQKEIKTLRQMLSCQVKYSNEGLPSMSSGTLVNYSSDSEPDSPDKSSIPKRSAVIISKQERLSYEQKIAEMNHKYDLDHLSRGRLEKALKKVKAEYDNYRLKHEYKVQKLQTLFKTKLKRLTEEENNSNAENSPSDESAYVSATTSDTGNLSHDSLSSDKQDKKTLLSPLRDNVHLWSYQWLKCYCDTNKRALSRGTYSPSQDLSPDFHCVCLEQVRQNKETEKASQTCEACIRRTFNSMSYVCQTTETAITSQPEGKSETSRQEVSKNKDNWSGICCWLSFVSFFGEKVTWN